MFGKGVYLADISSKSAGYCASYLSGGIGLLLLCETELGKPMHELVYSDYNAGAEAKKKGCYSTWGQGMTAPAGWKDAECVHESLKGVMMVCLSSGGECLCMLISLYSRILRSRLGIAGSIMQA